MPNRIIKESLWASESLSRCSIAAQGFFLRLLPFPDDHGCFDARASILRARLFPLNYAQVNESVINKWLSELEAVDCLRFWTHDGVRYGLFPSFDKHQSVRSLHHRKTPAPPENLTAKTRSENKGDSGCKQLQASDALNPNPFPNPNPVLYVLPADAFDKLWERYPVKDGRKDAERRFSASVKTEQDLQDITTALDKYLKHLDANSDWGKRAKNGDTWFNKWRDWVNWVEPEKKHATNSHAGTNNPKPQGLPGFVPKQR